MKVVIPMSGEGKRFKDAGFHEIKPLIKVGAKCMIEHVIGMFDREDEFLFVARKDHLAQTALEKVLAKAAPDCEIIGIDPHKLGPVHAVMKAEGSIDDSEPVIVNYCDFLAVWDYHGFSLKTRNGNWDGGILGYCGLHPHLLWQGLYAGMRVGSGMELLEIREKHSFTKDMTESYHSAGTYSFASGALMKRQFRRAMDDGLAVNGEYYVSSAYEPMLKDGMKVFVQEAKYFLQWGTPQDLREYIYWKEFFSHVEKKRPMLENTTVLLPMAGDGKRFCSAGYSMPKPSIPVSGMPMFVHAINSLPLAANYVLVCQESHLAKGLAGQIEKWLPDAKVVVAKHPTGGQADSCMLAKGAIDPDCALLVAACDNTVLFDFSKLKYEIADRATQALIWTFRNNRAVGRNPAAYAYVETGSGNCARKVSCKKPISQSPMSDHALTGIFYFRKARDFFDACKSMAEKNIRINGELYADTVPNELINAGKRVRAFEVDKYIVFGTPQDLLVYNYWKGYFTQTSREIQGPDINKGEKLFYEKA